MGLSALVVDDSPIIRSVLVRCLGLSGLPLDRIDQAGHGEAALASLRQAPVDLLFCDLHMPVMDGVTMLRTLSEEGRLKTMTAIVISSDRSQDRRAVLSGLGVRGFLDKPFTPEGVRDAVRALRHTTGIRPAIVLGGAAP